jgi:hypothetical protein
MNLNELKGKYARLRDEIDALGGIGEPGEAKHARLMRELDQVDEALAAYRALARSASALTDTVGSPEPLVRRANGRRSSI